MKSAKPAWSDLHERLARIRESMTDTGGRSREAREDILLRRAERMARRKDDGPSPEGVEYLLLRAGGREFAVETSWVSEVMRPQAILEVPGAPDGVVGVFSLRGGLVPVLVLPALAGLTGVGQSPAGAPLAVVLFRDDRKAAFLAAEVMAIKTYVPASIGPLLGSSLEGITGVAPGGELVLDAARLFEAVPSTGFQ